MKQKIQIVLVLAMVVAGIRLAWIFYERHEAAKTPEKAEAPPLNPDYYVIPKKLHPYDLKSARQLTEQPVWVKEGYRYTYYRYDTASKRVDFAHDSGLLGPIEKVMVTDVVMAPNPKPGQPKQVMAVFD